MGEGEGEELRLPELGGLMPLCLSFSICILGGGGYFIWLRGGP